MIRCRNDRHRQDAVNFHDDGLGEFLARNVRQCGHALRGVGQRMRNHHVLDIVGIEKFTQLGERHTTSSGIEFVEGPLTRCCAKKL
jgi:hypothetical protein